LITETRRRAAEFKLNSPEAVRHLGQPLVAFSEDLAKDLLRLRQFLQVRMYRHYTVNRSRSRARRLLHELFDLFLAEPEVLPPDWAARLQGRDA
ncbi:hypothetical protein, partial [Campylobacter coli]|uniref:hypothetical protein n=1 Tax=Campylobacter coli TaxID=195 RepID=UPI003F7C2302